MEILQSCVSPLQIARPKLKTLGYSTWFFITLGNPTLFLINPWKFCMLFLWNPWKLHILNHPICFFFWNSPLNIELCAMPMSTNSTVIGPGLISFSTYHSCWPKFNFVICQIKGKVKRVSKHKLKFKSKHWITSGIQNLFSLKSKLYTI